MQLASIGRPCGASAPEQAVLRPALRHRAAFLRRGASGASCAAGCAGLEGQPAIVSYPSAVFLSRLRNGQRGRRDSATRRRSSSASHNHVGRLYLLRFFPGADESRVKTLLSPLTFDEIWINFHRNFNPVILFPDGAPRVFFFLSPLLRENSRFAFSSV